MRTIESAKFASSIGSGLSPSSDVHPIDMVASDPHEHITWMEPKKVQRGVHHVGTDLDVMAIYKPAIEIHPYVPSEVRGIYVPDPSRTTDMLAVAAHRFNQALGFHAVPHVAKINLAGHPMASGEVHERAEGRGHIQQFVGGPTWHGKPPSLMRDDPSIHEVAAMHWMAHERDGHGGNVALSTETYPPRWMAYDHDDSFAIHPHLLISTDAWRERMGMLYSMPLIALHNAGLPIPSFIREAAARVTPKFANDLFDPIGFPREWSAWCAAKASMLAEMTHWPRTGWADKIHQNAETAKRALVILGQNTPSSRRVSEAPA